MMYQLPTGKVIEISTEQFFSMTDEELEYLIAFNYGDVVENPWQGSVLTNKRKTEDSPETVPDLTDIPTINTLSDLDTE